MTVRKFKSMLLIDLREYYGEEGNLKPGSKGISLTKDLWIKLKDCKDEIELAMDDVI